MELLALACSMFTFMCPEESKQELREQVAFVNVSVSVILLEGTFLSLFMKAAVYWLVKGLILPNFSCCEGHKLTFQCTVCISLSKLVDLLVHSV